MVKEAVGCEINNFSSELNCMAIQVKLELYTSETIWKNSDLEQNRTLLTFIQIVEQNLMDTIMRLWNIDMQGKGYRGSIYKVDLRPNPKIEDVKNQI